MMEREWKGILARYGCPVTVCTEGQKVETKAFMQPVLDKQEQLVPSALGLRTEERVLWLGPAEVSLFPGSSEVEWNGAHYAVRSTRPVGDGHHVWAILQRLEDEA